MTYDTKVSIKVIKTIYKVVILEQKIYGINMTFSIVSVFGL